MNNYSKNQSNVINAANYFQNILIEKENNTNSQYEMINGFKYYNFIFISNDNINETSFNFLCKYDYYVLNNIGCPVGSVASQE